MITIEQKPFDTLFGSWLADVERKWSKTAKLSPARQGEYHHDLETLQGSLILLDSVGLFQSGMAAYNRLLSRYYNYWRIRRQVSPDIEWIGPEAAEARVRAATISLRIR